MNDPALLESLRTAVWVPCAGVVVALVWRAWKVVRDEGTWKTRGVWVAAASAAAALLFAGAAHNPRLWKNPPTFPRIVLLLDVSDSVLGGNGGWDGMLKAVKDRLGALTVDVSRDNRKKMAVTIVACGGATSVMPETTLAELPEALDWIRESNLVPGGASDLGGGLSKARNLLDGKPGLILLFSDGLETNNGAKTAAQALAANGVEVHTFPLSSGPAPEGLTAFDLPPVAQIDKPTMLRSMIAGPDSLTGTVAVNFAPRRGERAPPAAAPETFGRGLRRTSLIFGEHGLQCAQVTWHVSGGTVSQCLYTYVHHTPEVLCIGDGSALTKVLDHRPARIVPRTPSEVRPEDFTNGRYDAVVLDSIPARLLSAPALEALARAHKTNGMGILFINGQVTGEKKDASLLASYLSTSLAELLPLKAQAKGYTAPPERRDNIFLVDISDSMTGLPDGGAGNRKDSRIQIAIAALVDVVGKLHLKDRLYILPYAGETYGDFNRDKMGEDEKKEAKEFLESLATKDDGTKAGAAFETLRERIGPRKLEKPKLYFIGDGDINIASVPWVKDFEIVLVVIDSKGNFFRREGAQILQDPSFTKVEPIFLENGSLNELTEKYFNIKPIPHWQDSEPFTPQAEHRMGLHGVKLPGSAFATLSPGATTIASRPGTKDPVLAERRSEAGGALALASGIPPEALQEGELQEAVWSWLESLLPTDRYELRAEVRGDDIVLEIAPKPRQERGVEESLEVTWKSLDPEAIYSERRTLRRAEDLPDTFRGVFPLRPLRAMVQGRLKIEDGRETAYVQMALPSAAATSVSLNAAENRWQGRDDDLLKKVSEVTGGIFDPQRLPALSPEEDTGREIWKELCVLGVVAYLAAIWKRDWTPWGGK